MHASFPNPDGRSANDDTDWQKIPEYRLAEVMTEIITWTPWVTGEAPVTKADLASQDGRQVRVPADGFCPDPGSGVRIPAGGSNTNRPLITVQMAREPRVVVGRGERNLGSLLDDDVGVRRYIGGGHRSH